MNAKRVELLQRFYELQVSIYLTSLWGTAYEAKHCSLLAYMKEMADDLQVPESSLRFYPVRRHKA